LDTSNFTSIKVKLLYTRTKKVATTIQLGKNPFKDAHGRNYVEGYDAGYELQRKRLAFELAKKIRADRQNLLSKLGKSQEETTAP